MQTSRKNLKLLNCIYLDMLCHLVCVHNFICNSSKFRQEFLHHKSRHSQCRLSWRISSIAQEDNSALQHFDFGCDTRSLVCSLIFFVLSLSVVNSMFAFIVNWIIIHSCKRYMLAEFFWINILHIHTSIILQQNDPTPHSGSHYCQANPWLNLKLTIMWLFFKISPKSLLELLQTEIQK